MKFIMENWRKTLKEQINVGQQIGSELVGAAQSKGIKSIIRMTDKHIQTMDSKLNILEKGINYLLDLPAEDGEELRGLNTGGDISRFRQYLATRQKKLSRIINKISTLQSRK